MLGDFLADWLRASFELTQVEPRKPDEIPWWQVDYTPQPTAQERRERGYPLDK